MCEKYSKDKIIMIGDAPGDRHAADVNGIMFYPIIPSYEDNSWMKFYNDAFDKFITGQYCGEYEKKVKRRFNACLPSQPNWYKKRP